MSYKVAAVDKALELLELLAHFPDLGVTDIAERTQSTKSQVFRILHTLEQRGFVKKHPTSRSYSLGYRTLFIGNRSRQQNSLVKITQPCIDELAERCRENVHLIVREEFSSVCVALRESPQQIRLYAEVGRRGPLHAGGGSKVLLAYAPSEVKEAVLTMPLEKFTSETITDPKKLKVLLDKIIEDGYHESKNDLDDGAFSIAAPIRDHSGNVVAALSIAGPVSRLDESTRHHHRALVREYSDTASKRLGCNRGPDTFQLAV